MTRDVVDTAFMRAEFPKLGIWDRFRVLVGAAIVVRAEVDSHEELDLGGHRIHLDVIPRGRWRRVMRRDHGAGSGYDPA